MRRAIVILFLLTVVVAVPQETASSQARFMSYDLVIDAGNTNAAAWQVKLTYDRSKVSIVGIEADSKAPYYDQRGLRVGEIVIANFYTNKEQQFTGKGQVCRLHLRVVGKENPKLSVAILALADGQGKGVSGAVSVKPTTNTGEKK